MSKTYPRQCAIIWQAFTNIHLLKRRSQCFMITVHHEQILEKLMLKCFQREDDNRCFLFKRTVHLFSFCYEGDCVLQGNQFFSIISLHQHSSQGLLWLIPVNNKLFVCIWEGQYWGLPHRLFQGKQMTFVSISSHESFLPVSLTQEVGR